MFLSVFEMFKVGIGPSSSHTIGPMVAASRFLDHLRALPFTVAGLRASLHGSLAFTGVGHATNLTMEKEYLTSRKLYTTILLLMLLRL